VCIPEDLILEAVMCCVVSLARGVHKEQFGAAFVLVLLGLQLLGQHKHTSKCKLKILASGMWKCVAG
jgi:hypothetical protein